jgi:lysophospholipase L1-like esterase
VARHAADKPVRFILVGDSTMASTSGYGDAFCARVNRANTCINLAKGGRSSGSFRAEAAGMKWKACCAARLRTAPPMC